MLDKKSPGSRPTATGVQDRFSNHWAAVPNWVIADCHNERTQINALRKSPRKRPMNGQSPDRSVVVGGGFSTAIHRKCENRSSRSIIAGRGEWTSADVPGQSEVTSNSRPWESMAGAMPMFHTKLEFRFTSFRLAPGPPLRTSRVRVNFT